MRVCVCVFMSGCYPAKASADSQRLKQPLAMVIIATA